MLPATIIFFLSRFWFLNWSDVFFDSKEYLTRWADPSFISAIIHGHPPLHAVYVALYWPVYQLLSRIGVDPGIWILFLQSTTAWITLLFFGGIVKMLGKKKMTWRAMTLMALVPLFWIVNITVMMETTYLFFFMGSLFFLLKYLTDKVDRYLTLCLSVIFWIAAFLTHTVIILWIPLFIYLAWSKNRTRSTKVFLTFIAGFILSSSVNALVLSWSMGSSFPQGFYWLYLAKFGEHAAVSANLLTLLRYVRNWIIPLFYNSTSPIVIIGLIGLVSLWKKERKLFWIMLLWFFPSFVANQWWDSLLFGRHALIAIFALVFCTAEVINEMGYRILVLLTLSISLSALRFMSQPAPYQVMAKTISDLPGGSLVIDSHFARPYTDGQYFGKMIFVDEPGWNLEMTEKLISEYVDAQKPVFVTGEALSEPYGLFSGPFLHPLSLSYKNSYILAELPWGFAKYKEIDKTNNLMIYKIYPDVDHYAKINKLNKSQRRIDYLDPLRILMSYLPSIQGLNL